MMGSGLGTDEGEKKEETKNQAATFECDPVRQQPIHSPWNWK
jgi:hypothetical protein